MPATPFTFQNQSFLALPSGALFWAEKSILCLSDMHLGKSERLGRRGGSLLPPYEIHDTLLRLAEDIQTYNPKTIICLGDSFDDMLSAENLPEPERLRISQLQAGREWVWIEGNHDPEAPDLGGTYRRNLQIDAITFQHIADPHSAEGEISGHYHPKINITLKGAFITRACFMHDEKRLILPAYGTYTGGLKVGNQTLRQLFAPTCHAILTGPTPGVLCV